MALKIIYNIYKLLYLLKFIFSGDGADYAISFVTRMRIVLIIYKNCKNPGIASTFMENILLARQILSIPEQLEGNIAEYGSYKGISSANLSIVCKLAKRKLYIFDSFSGLPETKEIVKNITDGKIIKYKKGDYTGTLDEVKRNITKLGEIEVCEFIPGYFDESLPKYGSKEKFVMIFEDVDLPSSVRIVLEYSWPLLQEGCHFFSHEARDMEVVKIFFDDVWWEKTLKCKSPGLVGSGIGLPLERDLAGLEGLAGSYMGYVIKNQIIL